MSHDSTGLIRGQVLDEDDSPIEGAAVFITGGDHPHHDIASLTDEDGAFEIHDLIPGTYTIQARAPDDRIAVGTVRVRPGTPAEVELRLE